MKKASALEGIRLVALDLDGTLLPSDKVLTDRAKGVIRDLGDAGIAVTLATGRGWANTSRYARELGLANALVSFEGGLVACAGDGPAVAPSPPPARVLHRRLLTEAQLAGVVREVCDLALGWFVTTEHGRTLVSERLRGRVAEVSIWDPHIHYADATEGPGAAGHILHLVGPPDDVREAHRRVTALHGDAVDTFLAPFWGGDDQLQVRPTRIGKEVGLRHVLDDLGLDAEHVLAAGDWHNDLGMLRMARVAVAPGNAVPEVRELADHVLDATCDDDAVVRFLGDQLRSA